MVNNPRLRKLVVAQYALRTRSDGRRYVDNGPIFDLNVIKQVVRENNVHVLNPNAEESMIHEFDPDLEPDEIRDIIVHGLRSDDEKDHYVESELCKANGMPVDCDAYSIRWNRTRRIESDYSRAIYLKFGFKDNIAPCLIVRVHYDKYR